LNNSISFRPIVVFAVIIALTLVIVTFEISLSTSITTYGQRNQVDATNSSNNKVVILTFGDTHKSQFSTAKPILDKYGFKASFFIVVMQKIKRKRGI
jgi:peptidoglycan/xylan/chitin deacetylase (PgdA/CDA1 family)